MLLLARLCLLAGEKHGESIRFQGPGLRQRFLPRAARKPPSSRWAGPNPEWRVPGSPLEYIWVWKQVKNIWGERGMPSAFLMLS